MSAAAITLHVLAVILWIGGMFFAAVAVRPTLAALDPMTAARFWAGLLGRFIPWVWGAIVVLLATGFYMVANSFDGLAGAPWFVHLMMGLGIFMMLMFGHLSFSAHKRLKRAVAANDQAALAKPVRQIRVIMAVSLALGFIIILVAMLGGYLSID